MPSNRSICHIPPSLRLIILTSLQAYCHFFFSKSCSCDICDWSHLPSLWLGSRDDYSPTVLTAPSSRSLVPSCSLIRCEPVQVYHHHLCSRAVLWTSLLSFQRGAPLHNVQSVTSCSPVEDLTICFTTSNL
jgi:hypothetical protein